MSDVTPQLSFELRPWRELDSLSDQWAGLGARAEPPNIFFDPAFALPAAEALGVADRLHAALFWTGDGQERRLAGFLPLITRRRWIVTPPNLEVWTHRFAPASLPLAEPGLNEALGQALVKGLAETANMPRILLMPDLVLDSAFAMELLGAGAPLFVHNGYQKPMASAEFDGAGYLAHALRSKRRGRLNRYRNELAEQGALTFHMVREAGELEAACARFTQLEASGWKGRRGSSLSHDAAGRQLFDRLIDTLSADGRLQVAELSIAGATIASIIVLGSQGHFWLWKTAFDERYADQSPGFIALVDTVAALLDGSPGAVIDSCAVEAGHYSGGVLRECCAMGDVLLSTRPRPNIIFRTANLLESVRGALRTAKRRMRS